MEERPEIFTVGHSTHPIERFLRLLGAHAIETLADVRRYPASRRNPQFNASALAASLERAGIGYAELGESLGGRRRVARRTTPSSWRNPAFAAYADYMRGEEFAAGLARLEELGRERRTAYVCAEADWHRCHRRLISDALESRGWRVMHIGADGRTERHPPTIFD
jgi:uncharacterized protein (DUF488 family)